MREGSRLVLTLDVPAGGHHDLVLEISDTTAARARRRTPTGPGRRPSTPGGGPFPRWTGRWPTRDVRQSFAVLRGMTSADGGMVAASTMSLPERADQGRDYDYRYAWIRDQCYAGQAVAAYGPHTLLDSAVGFVSERLLDDGPGSGPPTR